MVEYRLTAAIATTSVRVCRLRAERLPRISGVCWQVFVQGDSPRITDIRSRLEREDIQVLTVDGWGVARNRNAALSAVSTELLWFADDDLEFRPEGIAAIIRRFDATPEADILCPRLEDETGHPRKRYEPDGTRLQWFNCAKLGTPEIALRPQRVRAANVWFDPAFGLGTRNFLGDEFIFLCDALRAGLRGAHIDVTVAMHRAASSGAASGLRVAAVRRCVLIRALGRGASWPARLLFAWRHRKTLGGLRGLCLMLIP